MIHADSYISQLTSSSVLDQSQGSAYETKVELPVLDMNHTIWSISHCLT